jgi:Adenylate and Guanylate cyclase catalytic domain
VPFGQVLDHYDVLRAAIAGEEGALVKTIGDSVMAVLQPPVQGLRAVFRAQAILANPPDGRQALHLKAGIHAGLCVAVTLNDRLDYLGATVNLATRPGVVVSGIVIHDPEVAEWTGVGEARAEPFITTIKDFEDQHIDRGRSLRQWLRPVPQSQRPAIADGRSTVLKDAVRWWIDRTP